MAEIFDSEEEEVSEVESFVLTEDLEEEAKDLLHVDPETRALLQAAAGLSLSDEAHEVDPESRARLEKLLEAAGLNNVEPEILRRLTSSVSCALDEAAAALTRMRQEAILEKQKQHTSPSPLVWSDTVRNKSSSDAGASGRPSIVEDLDSDACCSLIDACNEGDLEAVRRLLEEGRNVNEVTEDGESLLSLACSSGYLELAQLLLTTTRANVEDRGLKDTTPLMEAASAGHFDIVRLLLDHGADVNAQTSQGNTPLMYAASGSSADHECVVRQLLDAGANVSDSNENGHTPLMEAASAGNVEIARILVEHGASINTHSNEFKESALTLACYKGHLEMVRFLLEAGADQEHKTEEMHTALMEASMDGHVQVARLLLDSGAQVNMPADSFESPLTLAACGGHVELAMLLLERGANIEEVNDEGYTPLMEAAREGHEEMVALLLSQGADINAQTEETQETALTLACCGGFLEVAEFLIKAGADIEAGANTPLAEAAQEGHLNLVQHLLESDANVNATSASGDTPLMYACENGHTDVAEVLLEAGASLEHEADGGRTPLMKAARAGHLPTVKFLVSTGANINKVTSNNDHTPLSLACAGGHTAVVEYLLAHGADSTHRLKDNSTMLIEASKGGHTQIVQLLIEHPLRSSPSPLESGNFGPSSSRVMSCLNASENASASGRGEAVTAVDSISQPAIPSKKLAAKLAAKGISSRKSSKSSVTESDCIKTSVIKSASDSNAVDTEKALKETERLEQCINSMMKRTEMLNPSKEEQILQKQQILEELQRVEKELQTKTQAQLLLSAQTAVQSHQQRQIMQALSSGDEANPVWPSLTREEAAALWTLTQETNLAPESVGVGDSVSGTVRQRIAKAKKKLKASCSPSPDSHAVSDTEAKLNQKNIHDSQQQEEGHEAVSPAFPPPPPPSCDSSPPADASCLPRQQTTSQATQTLPVSLQDASGVIATALATDHQSTIKLNLVSGQATLSTTKTPSAPGNVPVTSSTVTTTTTLPPLTSKQLQILKEQLAAAAVCQSVDASGRTISKSLVSGTGPSGSVSLSLSATLTTRDEEAKSEVSTTSTTSKHKVMTARRSKPFTASSVASQTLVDGNWLDRNKKTEASSASSTSSSKSSSSINNNQVCSSSSSSSVVSGSNTTSSSVPSPPPFFNHSIEIDGQTDSNHDTALTVSCSGGHEELVSLLLARGANCEHRDKKGFTPLMLAATQGHGNVCEILLNHGVDLEAQSERTKDTALSLACSSGRYEVVELLLDRGANKEHRNVSDYTPLSLAASGGYVNIIKLLLNHGAEINSRTGSKLGISPLMLAAMNGHAATVKLLLDMGSDINAQIETNRNTALTLACFQGRCEVVSLLLDRKANVEHRAKTGLTPLMEAASGGYVEVGRILLEKGADVNAPPVPSSRDTALTIAADKGHYRFVELLIKKGGSLLNLDARNKKGSSPLWLAANGGHLDVVQLLVNSGADIDAQDNRKVSCLMAAFRKGHLKVVKWMVKHVSQFPSDQEMTRYLALVGDKELLKKCNQCMEIIRQAKDKQAAEANKNATILLEELDKEKMMNEKKKENLAKKREMKKQKVQDKQDKKGKNKGNKNQEKQVNKKPVSESESESEESDDEDSLNIPAPDSTHEPTPPRLPVIDVPANAAPSGSGSRKQSQPEIKEVKVSPAKTSGKIASNNAKTAELIVDSKTKTTKNARKENQALQPEVTIQPVVSVKKNTKTQPEQKPVKPSMTITKVDKPPQVSQPKTTAVNPAPVIPKTIAEAKPKAKTIQQHDVIIDPLQWTNDSYVANGEAIKKAPSKEKRPSSPTTNKVRTVVVTNKQQSNQRSYEDPEWKEVSRRQKRITVPSSAISRVIGRGGCNINAVREYSGAHIEVEKQKGQQSDRLIIIRGSSDATKNAHAMINSLVNEPEKDLAEIIAELGLEEPPEKEEDSSKTKTCSTKSTVSKSQPVASMVFSSTQLSNSAFSSTSSKCSKTPATSAPFASTWTGPSTSSVKSTASATPSGSPSKESTFSSKTCKSPSATPTGGSNEYTPFNNLFTKVGAGVWGGKDHKLNFATVAARGTVMTTSSSPAPVNTATTTSTMGLQQAITVQQLEASPPSEPSKAPGFRGNFVSPSSASPLNVTNTAFQSSGSAPSSPPPMSSTSTGSSVRTDLYMHSMTMDQRVVSPPIEGPKGAFSLAPGSRNMPLSPSRPQDQTTESMLQQETEFRADGMQTSPNSSGLNPNAQSYAPEVLASMNARGVIGRPSPREGSRGQTSGAPVPFESLPNPQLQMQMRAAILAAGASLQMQTLQQQAQAQRFQQQQQAAAAAAIMGTPDFSPPSAETLRMLQTALQGAAAAATPSSTSFNAQQTQQQPNPIGSRVVGSKLSDLTGGLGHQTGIIDESKSLPRPIGTERAQRTKNPPGVIGTPFGFNPPGMGTNSNDLWQQMTADMAHPSDTDWLNAQFSADLLQSSMNRPFDTGFVDPVLDQSFQFNLDPGYGTASTMMPPFMNGLTSPMGGHPGQQGHHSSHGLGAMAAPPMQYIAPLPPSAEDYWSGKLPNGLEPTMDHKNMSWQTPGNQQHHSWSHHQQ